LQKQYEAGEFTLASAAARKVDAALDAYGAADAANDGTDPLESIGLIGADPSVALAAAATAVEEGRTEDAVAQAAAARDAWQGARGAGILRVGVGGAVVLVGGSVVGLRVRRRRHGRSDAET
jgi:hypothetical protein